MPDPIKHIRKAGEDTPSGLAFAITAYVFWGFLPLYMKLVAHIPAAEVVVHRIFWSLPIAAGVVILSGRTSALLAALRSPKMLMLACLTATLVSINWGIYVWAIASGNALDAALGYYINPLFSILLAAVVLGERLSRSQVIAILLAAAAVIVVVVEAGRMPWAAIGMMLSWGFYALGKKSLPIGPNQGFVLEVMILMIPAIGYFVYLTSTGQSHFSLSFDRNTLLLIGCGAVTAVPLMIYANGAKRLRLSTIGILQYIAPTIIFLIAVFVFEEPFGKAEKIAFPMIWLALLIYTNSMLRQMRLPRQGE